MDDQTDDRRTDDRILPIAEVVRMTSLSRTTLYAFIRDGSFPPPLKLGKKRSGWKQSEIQNWIHCREPARHGKV